MNEGNDSINVAEVEFLWWLTLWQSVTLNINGCDSLKLQRWITPVDIFLPSALACIAISCNNCLILLISMLGNAVQYRGGYCILSLY